MPERKRHRIMIWSAFFVVSGIIAAQLLYPLDRAVPFARLGSQTVGWRTEVDLSQVITQSFQASKLRIKAGDDTATYSLSSSGAEVNAETMALSLSDYPFWQRFIPLSILWQLPHVDQVVVTYNNQALDSFIAQQQKHFRIAPVNAGVAIKAGKLVATHDTPGRTVEADAFKSALVHTSIGYGAVTTVQLDTKAVPAEKQSRDVEAVAAQAEAALARTITITAKDKSFTPKPELVATWLTLNEDEHGATTLGLNKAAVSKYIAELDKSVGTPAGQTNVTLENGIEVARDVGKVGAEIDATPLIGAIRSYLLDGEGSGAMQASLIDVAPSIIYNRRYTATESGLQAYVHDAARDQNANIVVEQLSNKYWSASANAGLSTVSASTYKLYVALYLFDQMNQGKIHWDDPMLDTTVSGCFDRMTIASTNPCA
ncbi:MAG TPA: peptidoglycan binding domain-containing protein, partial [Patescibacteria group bacterium]|nr:peptidoglycan binding domain-containing protein [Patescibacteria group bacterium]